MMTLCQAWPAAVTVEMPLALGFLDSSPDDHGILFRFLQH